MLYITLFLRIKPICLMHSLTFQDSLIIHCFLTGGKFDTYSVRDLFWITCISFPALKLSEANCTYKQHKFHTLNVLPWHISSYHVAIPYTVASLIFISFCFIVVLISISFCFIVAFISIHFFSKSTFCQKVLTSSVCAWCLKGMWRVLKTSN